MTLAQEIEQRNRQCWREWQLAKLFKTDCPDAKTPWARGAWTFFHKQKLDRAKRWLFKLRAARYAAAQQKRMFTS